MESIPTNVFEDNLEYLVNLGYINIHVGDNEELTMSLSPKGKQRVEEW
jgi:hypothetical protein